MPLIGELFAVFAAFCYSFGSVAIAKNARDNGGSGNAVLLSVVLTAVISGVLWLFMGPPLSGDGFSLLKGVGYFALAGILSTVLGRLFFFRSVELVGAIETGLMRRLIPVFAAALAVVLLGEQITIWIGLAFVLVFSGVAIAVFPASRQRGTDAGAVAQVRRQQTTGRVFAVTSAASYGGSYVTRKFGMQWLPDPLAGAFIGAVTGLAWFCLAAPFSEEYRGYLKGLFRKPAIWQTVAACSISIGQTSQFVALKFTSVTVVAIIGTIEVFLSVWLAAYVVKTEPRPGRGFVIASLLAMAGVVVLALARTEA